MTFVGMSGVTAFRNRKINEVFPRGWGDIKFEGKVDENK